jgi:hypothetical protein
MSLTTPLQVNIFRYNRSISLSTIPQNSIAFDQFAKNIADDIMSSLNLSPIISLNVLPRLLEQFNVRYTEKWVKRVDENFFEYYHGYRPRLNVYPRLPTRHAHYIFDKFFSGDVSGMISESLFVYFLQILGVNINLVSHLRPLKLKNGFTPDFAIWDSSSNGIRILVNSRGIKSPIYAEVKGSTGPVDKEKIKKALNQLRRLITNNSYCGLVFLAFRNALSVYEGVLMEVTF